MKNFYGKIVALLEKKIHFACATIIQTTGSTPQVTGASAIFSSEGLMAGTLGGGLLEANAKKTAFEALARRRSVMSEHSLNAEITSEEGVCGGKVTVLIDGSPDEHEESFTSLWQSLSERKPGVLATLINQTNKNRLLLKRHWADEESLKDDLSEPLHILQDEIRKSFSEGKHGLIHFKKDKDSEFSGKDLLYLEPVFPRPQLLIAGAGHVGKAVAHLGSLLDFKVIVIDDRPEFANKENIPDGDRISIEDIGKAIGDFPITSDTYIVIVTRGHSKDAEVLRKCIQSEAAYIGMIGSVRKTALMRELFLKENWATQEQWDRVCAPIGLEIQSKTVEEIAVSIAAQLVLVRGEKMRQRKDHPWFGP